MGIKVALNHLTQYNYDRPIALGPQLVRLRPAPYCRTPISAYSLKVTSGKHLTNWQQDPYNNHLARLVFPGKTNQLALEVDLIAELTATNPFDFFLEPDAENFPFGYSPELQAALQPYLTTEPAGPFLKKFLAGVTGGSGGTVNFLVALNQRVRNEVAYIVRLEPGVQTCEQTLAGRSGSCRDSAWLLIQILRHLGLAARFVSGYLIQLTSDDSPSGTTDSADLHAWAEVFLPGAGWIGFDPTSGLLTGEGHIPLACTPDTNSSSPLSGTAEPAAVDFHYSMSVRRLDAAAITEAPFTEAAWARLEAVAEKVDSDLQSGDVRLTMGGEPTFVGIDDPDSPQWNGDAMGPLKLDRGITLIKRVRERLAPGALLHFGQGKWYPGEPLPRWALSCHSRTDGVPVWDDIKLIAREDESGNAGAGDSLGFIQALSRRLQVSSANILPAYEDAFYYLWKERRLPVNVEAFDSKLGNSRERAELARVFESGPADPVGYVLPIRRRQNDGKLYWSSQLWFLRPGRLLLIQGDSPLGYRLPLDSLPWVDPDDVEYDYEDDPFADRERLPTALEHKMRLFDVEAPADPLPASPKTGESAKGAIRPALCVEVREGRLHVFLPYTPKLADYLDLVTAVEDTCAYLKRPVWIEGYKPSSDPRLSSFSVTPDPGVIEVNLPPARTWAELRKIQEVVYEEASESRLTTEKFLYDGKHTSTGGGNHIVIGGATAPDSPFLRRPDLLRSMIAFWQHHPSLSYLFSGMFIGPTSQHPRVDEARMDSLYELEIAFSQLPSGECPPWLVDRLFRNLLIDMTGNTHRAEFCIDKLYPPEGAGARLGLLELRAFEMAPHVRMELAELLLVRALTALFWRKPYQSQLVRWGTALHDRFLLPHFVQHDFFDVLSILQRGEYQFEEDWFRPHLDFRFPKIGSIEVDGLHLELRRALEPWHVLGEEATAGGTVRRVDSSLQRLQVKLTGAGADSRYVVACNGRRVPLHPTGKPGEAVAGVRYRAWEPSSSLHPTIPVHTPLVFDIVDTWNEHSLAGCRYHVVHPDGRWYSTRPVSAAEAESRRQERFEKFGHTPGLILVPVENPNPSFPMTLDLRWPGPSETNRLGDPAAKL